MFEGERKGSPEEVKRRMRYKALVFSREVNAREQVDGALRSQSRGGEGICQIMWTAVTCSVVYTVAEELSVGVEVHKKTVFLEPHFRVPKHISTRRQAR
eukprot:2761999-Amphidinium_carterae.1